MPCEKNFFSKLGKIPIFCVFLNALLTLFDVKKRQKEREKNLDIILGIFLDHSQNQQLCYHTEQVKKKVCVFKHLINKQKRLEWNENELDQRRDTECATQIPNYTKTSNNKTLEYIQSRYFHLILIGLNSLANWKYNASWEKKTHTHVPRLTKENEAHANRNKQNKLLKFPLASGQVW